MTEKNYGRITVVDTTCQCGKPYRVVFLDSFNNPICACHVEDIERVKREEYH